MLPDTFKIYTEPTGVKTISGYWIGGLYRDSIFHNGISWRIKIFKDDFRSFRGHIERKDEMGDLVTWPIQVLQAVYLDDSMPRRD